MDYRKQLTGLRKTFISMANKKKISIGIICFNEEPNIEPCYQALAKVAEKNEKYNFEFIFVDNGSTDNTREEIKKIISKDRRIVGVFLARNFGPEASTQASLDYASGDAFIMYEGDMQDPPEVILDFIKKWEKGFSVVVGVRTKIEDSFLLTTVRRLYYKIFRSISNIEVPVNAGSFGLIDKRVMDAIRKLPEKYRFYRGLRAWVGFSSVQVLYQRRKRLRGKSSYNFLGYIHHAERSLFGFSYLPLDIMVYTGFFTVFLSFFASIAYLLSRILLGQTLNEFIIILLSVVLFGGIQLLALSIVGKYIQVIVEETKGRPVYIVEEVIKK